MKSLEYFANEAMTDSVWNVTEEYRMAQWVQVLQDRKESAKASGNTVRREGLVRIVTSTDNVSFEMQFVAKLHRFR